MALGFNQFAPPTLRGFSAYGGANREPYMSPDQEQSILSKIGASTWGGIGAVGSFLDVPAGMIRNTFGGENPFTPLADPLSTTDRTPGRDLLVQYSGGIVPENYEGFSPSDPNAWKDLPWDIMGFATEVLLDPLTYLTLGASALGKVGKMAKGMGAMDDLARLGAKAGVAGTGPRMTRMTKTLRELFDLKDSKIYGHWHDDLTDFASKKGIGINELLDTELGSLGKWMGMGFGRGSTAQKVATGMDWMGDKLKYSAPVRYGRAMVDSRVRGAFTRAGQEAAEMATKYSDEAVATVRRDLFKDVEAMESAQWFDPHGRTGAYSGAQDPLADAITGSNEFGMQFARRVETGEAMGSIAGYTANDFSEATVIADRWAKTTELLRHEEQMWGGAVEEVDDVVKDLLENYFPHSPQRVGADSGARRAGDFIFDTNKPHIRQRTPGLTGFSGGMYPLQKLSLDDQISGAATRADTWTKTDRAAMRDLVRTKYGKDSVYANPNSGQYRGTHGLFGEGEVDYGAVSEWAAHLPKEHVAHNIPAFQVNPIKAMITRHEAGGEVIGAMKGMHEFLIDNRSTSGGELISDMFRRINGVDKDRAIKRLAFMAGKKTDDVKGWRVSKEVAGDVERFMRVYTEPESVAKVLDVYDSFIRTWKGAVTVIWPSFHARNLLSGQLRNMQAGAFSSSTFHDAAVIMRGNVMDDAAVRYAMLRPKGATAWTDEIATEALREELFAHKVLTHHAGMGQEFMGSLGTHSEVVGMSQVERARTGVVGGAYAPRPVPGTSAARRWSVIGEGAGVQRYGAGVAYYTEGLNRISPYLHKRKQGWAPKEASELVGMLQVNYERLTPTEKTVMRRIYPFWTFQKGVIPWTAKTLLEKPGGILAQTAKFPARVRSGAPSAPEYINETAAIPLRSDEPGSQKYLATLGLMEEPGYAMAAPLMRMATSPMDAGSDFIREMVGHTAPPIKALYEIGSGRSSFFGGGESGGRPLRTMSPPVGQIMENVSRTAGMPEQRPTPFGMGESQAGRAGEYLLGASPASRFLSSGRIATDTRKTFMEKVLNLVSGFKTYDISARQANAIVNENINRRLLDIGGYKFSRTTISDDTLAGMSPDARQEGEQLKMLQSVLQKKMKQ